MQSHTIRTILITILFIIPLISFCAEEEFQVNTYTTSDQDQSSVAMDAYGNFIITWRSLHQDGDNYGVFAQRFDKYGKKSGEEFQVNTYTEGEQSGPGPCIAADALGNFVIAWSSQGQDGSYYGIFAKRFNKQGVPQGGEFQVNTYTEGDQFDPSIAMNGDGGFIIAWTSYSQDGSYTGVYAQRFNRYGTVVGSEFRVNTTTERYERRQDVAMNSDGDFVIVWKSENIEGPDNYAFAQLYNYGGSPVGGEIQVCTFDDSYKGNPAVAMAEDGKFIVTWSGAKEGGDDYGIVAQVYDETGSKVGDEFQVNTYTSSTQNFPAIAIDADGNFVIVWESYFQDGSEQGIFAQKFDKNGDPVDEEFMVNTTTDDLQTEPSIAMNADGDFIISWTSIFQDGSQNGVFAKLFASGVEPDSIEFGLSLDPAKTSFAAGDSFNLLLDLKTPSEATTIDLYFVLLDPSNTLYFGLLWDMTPAAVLSNFTLPANFSLTDTTLLNISIPSNAPPISSPGTYTFAIGATEPGTLSFISNIAAVSFNIE